MNHDDIIRMARQVRDGGHWNQLDLINFAALVAAAERKAIETIVFGLCISDNNAQEIVNAIRQRSNQ